MALTADQLAQLRKMIDELDDAEGWNDTALELLASGNLNQDGTYNLNKAANAGWGIKAARYVELVRISESGSSRDLQQMFEHAITMAKLYGDMDGGEVAATPAPQSTKIVRATRSA